jgi:hypothetical protein
MVCKTEAIPKRMPTITAEKLHLKRLANGRACDVGKADVGRKRKEN